MPVQTSSTEEAAYVGNLTGADAYFARAIFRLYKGYESKGITAGISIRRHQRLQDLNGDWFHVAECWCTTSQNDPRRPVSMKLGVPTPQVISSGSFSMSCWEKNL